MQDKIVGDIGRVAMQTKGNLSPHELFIQNAFPEKSNCPIVLDELSSNRSLSRSQPNDGSVLNHYKPGSDTLINRDHK